MKVLICSTLVFFLLPTIFAHELCIDTTGPQAFTNNFCTDYNGKSCCSPTKEASLQTELQGLAIADATCASYMKKITCSECDPWGAHLFGIELQNPVLFPFLCSSYCQNFYTACRDVTMNWNGASPWGTNKIADAYPTAAGFCEAFNAPSSYNACYDGAKFVPAPPPAVNGTVAKEVCVENFAPSNGDGIFLQSVKDGTSDILVAYKRGVMRLFSSTGTQISTFLNITSKVYNVGEAGFLSFALHPNYATNGRFFVSYSCKNCQVPCQTTAECNGNGATCVSNFCTGGDHSTIIEEYARNPTDRTRASTTPVRTVFTTRQPYGNHNGGLILFGPDNYLYIFLGDGGSGNDPLRHAQNLNSLLGKILRVNIDSQDPGKGYSVPSDNPFLIGGSASFCASANENAQATLTCSSGQITVTSAFYGTPTSCPSPQASTCNSATSLSAVKSLCDGQTTCTVTASNSVFGDPCSGVSKRVAITYSCGGATRRSEIYALGVRNPWRASFDRADGLLYVGDVGQNDYEEVDIVAKGGNYGWRSREGFHDTPGVSDADIPSRIDPIVEYSHAFLGGGPSVTGGYVYRGTADKCLIGKYVYGDLQGPLFWAFETTPGSGAWTSQRINYKCVNSTSCGAPGQIFSFGEDKDANLYILGTSRILRVVDPSRCNIACAVSEGLKGEYFRFTNLTSLALTRTDATVNFDWATGSPASGLASDGFSVRWTGKVKPLSSGNYTFYFASDDGARLWVNNVQLINKWVLQSKTEWSGSIVLTAGQAYDIKIEYYENLGSASAQLSWSSAAQPKQVIPAARLSPN